MRSVLQEILAQVVTQDALEVRMWKTTCFRLSSCGMRLQGQTEGTLKNARTFSSRTLQSLK